ncbi:MAG: cation-translocating P-type ATPase [Flavobacterium sp.]|uniref:cation-translocating P-type ATPase n=1 Tax=Flavobacterium sp. TaxID=239 RepID=UPI0022CB3A95|nr:cation-translocating P-type ATPase [Flavobacterium sp.]MCZ8167890.1 cation-translocating P-type ATPase [Flavobacterium sp.]MCZ8297062.1 cation-translocating P-type ATPase [Flavobacterium sp.]
MNHHILSIHETQQLLKTSKNGLHQSVAEERLLENGRNELVEKKKKPTWLIFFNQFKDVMILLLLTAAVISIAIGHLKDAVVILIIVHLNALIGFIQEYRAEKAMDALKKMSASNSLVRRNGSIIEIASSKLVLGDIVILEAGNIVPADIRLSVTHLLKIEESSLTGESHSVDKLTQELQSEDLPIGDRNNMAFKSTIVSYGRGEGIVVATGMNTEIGRIAQLLQEDESQTPLQKRLADFSKKLSFVVIGICAVLYGVGLLRSEDPIQMLLTAISVAVAAIPEALPAIITIALALGAKRMVSNNALIRRLPSVETLGSITYICSDKTGTITQNKMTVTDIWQPNSIAPFQNFNAEELLLFAMELNHDVSVNESNKFKGDPTEIAIVEYARKHNLYSESWKSVDRVEELPFDAERKRMTTINAINDKYISVTKGAVESVLNCCTKHDDSEISKAVNQFAQQGKRVLAYAFNILDKLPENCTIQNTEQNLNFIGIVAMIDPPREEAKQAIADCHSAGITPVMITGDHPITAHAIAIETGIIHKKTDRVVTGLELEGYTDEEFEKEVEYIKVYARVSPEQKLQIVKLLQKKNQFVAMTGDGVNDAPALRRANIGIAMGIIGSDVSKEAAQMILLDDNFATIIKAVKEGRRIYENIRKFIKYTLTSNGGEIFTIFLAPLIGLPIPLIPIHILWINLVTDGLPGLAFAAEPAEENILQQPPRKTDESIFSKGLGLHILWVGLLMGAICLVTQVWATHLGNDKWQTMVFTVLCISQMGHAMAIRSDLKSLFQLGVFGNKQLVSAVLLTFTLQMTVIYVPFLQDIFHTKPLTVFELLICIGLSSIVFWAVEIEKWFKRRNLQYRSSME